MRQISRRGMLGGIAMAGGTLLLSRSSVRAAPPPIDVRETDDAITIETDALQATIRKKAT